MNNLVELVKDTKNLILENDRLKKEYKNKQLECISVMRRNFDSVLKEEVSSIKEVLDNIAELMETNKNRQSDVICCSKEIVNEDGCVVSEVIINIIRQPNYVYESVIRIKGTGGDEFGVCGTESGIGFALREENGIEYFDNLQYFDEVLLTEERALKLLDTIKEVASLVLTEYFELIKARNERLAEKIGFVSKALEQSSCVEEKVDGTVEFRIGGKTYIGTVKEV